VRKRYRWTQNKPATYNVPQKLDHPISLEEGHWGERNDDDVTAAAQWRV
jgi:hypothetical protein